MRVIGTRERTEIELDPTIAHRRGLQLDAMLRSTAEPRVRGVMRGPHVMFQRLDDARMVAIARRLNSP